MIRPLNGLLIFLLLATATVGLWKLFRLDEHLFNLLLPVQNFLIGIQAPVTYWIVTRVFAIPATFNIDTLYFMNGQALQEQPLCTALKQVFQMTLILILYPGPWKHKLWYIPVSSFFLLISAVIHLLILAVTLAEIPEHYSFMHLYISRWFFFGVYFLIWLYWEEKFSRQSNNKPVVFKGNE
jgi:exosortase/archaeosortase family protein